MNSLLSVDIRTLTLERTRRTLIRDFHLECEIGSVTGVLGPTNAGKSVLLRAIAGLRRGYEVDGEVVVDNRTICSPSRLVELVFQDYRLLPWKTAHENVVFGALDEGRAVREKAREILANMDLGHAHESYPGTLSGGEQARVALARALIEPPKVLLLDECFKSLDLTARELVLAIARDWIRKLHVTTVLVSHAVDDVLLIADRLVLLRGNPLETAKEVKVSPDLPRDPATLPWMQFRAEVEALVRQHCRNRS